MNHQVLRFDAGDDTLLLMGADAGLPVVAYWGPRLAAGEEMAALRAAWQAPVPHGGLDAAEPAAWLTEAGRGFTGTPGLQLRRGCSRCLTQCETTAVVATPSSLRLRAQDRLAGVAVALELEALHGAWRVQVRIENIGTEALEVDQAASLCLPVPDGAGELLSTGGFWAAEFHARRQPLGAWQQVARTGRSSHHAYPAVALLSAGCSSEQGQAWGLQLAWAGNHQWLVEPLRTGGHLLTVGELLLPGEVVLAPGECHSTAPVWLTRGGQGLRSLSAASQNLSRALLPALAPGRQRLVQCNTWEACYFDHDEARSLALAERAATLGVERFVLDDGWFAGRRSDRAGLGDWWPCPDRYPRGLAPLANRCRELGMTFGLWVEPESVNADSALYRAHPEWMLQDAGRRQPLGRNQYVLDMGRPAVQAHLFTLLDRLLADSGADYLKWDMNRDFTHEQGADGRPGARAHVMGLLGLQGRLRAAHPHVEIEACASGGGRADLGALTHQRRVWLSDCNDPLERQRMQAAFLQWLPAEIMGCHIGPQVSHTTGRASPLAQRSLNAVFGSVGLELDLLALVEGELEELSLHLAACKALRGRLRGTHVSAIDSTDPAISAMWAMQPGGEEAWLSLMALGRPANATPPMLRLPGLRPEQAYRLTWQQPWIPPVRPVKQGHCPGAALVLHGRTLASLGFRLPLLWPGDCGLLAVTAVEGPVSG